MKRVVTSVILAILVLSAFAALSAPNVKAQTSEAKILSYRWYVAPTSYLAEYVGDLVAVGEIQNIGTTTVGSAFVYGIAYNSSNLIVDTQESEVLAVNILPGQKAPFFIDFAPETSPTGDQSWVPSVTNVTVSLVTVLNSTQTSYSGLTIPSSSVSGSDVGGVYRVTGAIENTGNQIVGPVWALTTFYSNAGKVLSINLTDYLTNSLSPGSSVEFTATPVDNTASISSQIANYSFIAQYGSILTSSKSTTKGSVTPTPNSTSKGTQPTQTSTSKMNPFVTYGVVAAVVVIVAAVATLIMLRNRRNRGLSAPPPPPPPPPPP